MSDKPKRYQTLRDLQIEKVLREMEGRQVAPAPAAPASGDMPQASFSGYGAGQKDPRLDEVKRQQLIKLLQQRGR